MPTPDPLPERGEVVQIPGDGISNRNGERGRAHLGFPRRSRSGRDGAGRDRSHQRAHYRQVSPGAGQAEVLLEASSAPEYRRLPAPRRHPCASRWLDRMPGRLRARPAGRGPAAGVVVAWPRGWPACVGRPRSRRQRHVNVAGTRIFCRQAAGDLHLAVTCRAYSLHWGGVSSV